MNRKPAYLLLILCLSFTHLLQAQAVKTIAAAKPKIVVGIVIDQMRWDYLYRFSDLYVPNGFKRLVGEGFTCENTMVPYTPTYTAVGHTCVYTGSVPAISGIVGNNWYEKTLRKDRYCTDDDNVNTVGNDSSIAGKMSPENLWVTTIGDELKLSTNFKSKVIGVALKDRGAILPAGHAADAAYWYDDRGGKWITSTYYMNELPAWVKSFNDKQQVAAYMAKGWDLLLPADKYTQSTKDDVAWEAQVRGEAGVSFPHKNTLTGTALNNAFRTTPYAATFTFDFAKSAIENEKLGVNGVTDMLTISISSTDYIGHSFGPNSMEIEDAYLRLDRDIAAFLTFLDGKYGKGNYLSFLTADHAVAHVPAFLKEHKIPAGTFSDYALQKEIDTMIAVKYKVTNAVLSLQNYQVYLDDELLEKKGISTSAVKADVIGFLKSKPFIVYAFETDQLANTTIAEPLKQRMTNGYNPKRSGDIQFTLKPAYFDGASKGTTHGLWNPYDAHIPCVFYGWHIKPGKTNRETYMTDIAPTVAAMLQIQMPNGCVGVPVQEIVH